TTSNPINTTTMTNVAQSVVDENLPQLLYSRGGSHVTNVLAFDKKDFISWNVRFLVFLDGPEPYLLKTLEDGPFVPMVDTMPATTEPINTTNTTNVSQVLLMRTSLNFLIQEEGLISQVFLILTKRISRVGKLDYKGKYKGLKAKMVVLTKRINDMTKGKSEKGKKDKEKSEKGLLAESFDWDDEFVSSNDEGITKIKAFMAIAEDDPLV
nr:hypothetical protein [Tanacetum cinerariifolium]